MRLIDADALGTTNRPIGKIMMFGGEYVYTQTEIDSAPTVDAVPVCRCKDCKHSKTDGMDDPAIYCKKWDRWEMPSDFYCKYGKSKGGDE